MRLIIFMMIVFLLSSISWGRDYTSRGLIYLWDFNNERTFQTDIKSNVDGFVQGKIRWISPEFSYQGKDGTGVIHVHGDKNPSSLFSISEGKMSRHDLTDWTVDFEFAVGTHAMDPADKDRGDLVDGSILRWGDLEISFFRDPRGSKWRGVVVVNFMGKKKFINGVSGFDYHYMAIRSEDTGISIWFDSYCTNLVERPRRSVTGKKMVFGGSGFAGRLDDIKLYNVRLRPWEITNNYWGESLEINPKYNNIATSWAEIKQR